MTEERQMDRVVTENGPPVAAVSVTAWDERGDELIDAVEQALSEVYDV